MQAVLNSLMCPRTADVHVAAEQGQPSTVLPVVPAWPIRNTSPAKLAAKDVRPPALQPVMRQGPAPGLGDCSGTGGWPRAGWLPGTAWCQLDPGYHLSVPGGGTAAAGPPAAAAGHAGQALVSSKKTQTEPDGWRMHATPTKSRPRERRLLASWDASCDVAAGDGLTSAGPAAIMNKQHKFEHMLLIMCTCIDRVFGSCSLNSRKRAV